MSSDYTPPTYVPTPDDMLEEVEVKGTVTWDKLKGTVELNLDVLPPAEYNSLCLVYSEDDEDFQTFMEMVEPAPLD
jgi:hypothetical protein